MSRKKVEAPLRADSSEVEGAAAALVFAAVVVMAEQQVKPGLALSQHQQTVKLVCQEDTEQQKMYEVPVKLRV